MRPTRKSSLECLIGQCHHFIETSQLNWSVNLLTKFQYDVQSVFIQIGNKNFCPIGGSGSGWSWSGAIYNFGLDNSAKLNSQERKHPFQSLIAQQLLQCFCYRNSSESKSSLKKTQQLNQYFAGNGQILGMYVSPSPKRSLREIVIKWFINMCELVSRPSSSVPLQYSSQDGLGRGL